VSRLKLNKRLIRAARARGERINIGGRLLGIWGKGSEDATALGSDHYRGAPLLHKAEPF
jgi:hypothetical protein